MVCVFTVLLGACGQPAVVESSGSGDALPGSLQATHADAAWETIEADPSKKTCLSCHPRDTIVEATEDYTGVEGLNPHASHTESYDCAKCHSLTGTNVLVCNTACHGGWHGDGLGWELPNENWQNPTDELPAADGVAIPHNG